MPIQKQENFKAWHHAHKDEPFCFREQLLKYNFEDVCILASVSFRFIKITCLLEKEIAERSSPHPDFASSRVPVVFPQDPPLILDGNGVAQENLKTVHPTTLPVFGHHVVTLSSWVNLLLLKYFFSNCKDIPVLHNQFADFGYNKVSTMEQEFFYTLIHGPDIYGMDVQGLECILTKGHQRVFAVGGHLYSVDGYVPGTKTIIEFEGNYLSRGVLLLLFYRRGMTDFSLLLHVAYTMAAIAFPACAPMTTG